MAYLSPFLTFRMYLPFPMSTIFDCTNLPCLNTVVSIPRVSLDKKILLPVICLRLFAFQIQHLSSSFQPGHQLRRDTIIKKFPSELHTRYNFVCASKFKYLTFVNSFIRCSCIAVGSEVSTLKQFIIRYIEKTRKRGTFCV